MFKNYLSLFIILFTSLHLNAQLNPVSWSFTSKKIKDKKYEIHLVASIQPTWHLYSQLQPDDAIAIPTGIKFNSNPLVSMDGKIKELGDLIKFKDKTLGISANQYAKRVEFIQVIKLKGVIKTNVSGIVEYQTCDDKRCLPPRSVKFEVAVK